ncbi:hypothetical protein PHET_02258 [Paragonimus heterotremus]|uniref:FYVE-type domain-containing protein n=1 Tax=Paragonimus heterotremus TaxID=100268 RepID=A0A8J4T4D4_9TREM|nr:hypothetical protein PHET_02258 [Paragonimus heterotremus]
MSNPVGNTVTNLVNNAVNAVVGGTTQPAPAGIMDTVCAICQKTKFADGLGHMCAQCKRKTCTRCGFQLNTGINRVQWVCKSCAQHLDETVPRPNLTEKDSSLTANEDNAAGRLVSGFMGLITGQSSKGTVKKIPTLSSAIKRQLPTISNTAQNSIPFQGYGQAAQRYQFANRSSSLDQEKPGSIPRSTHLNQRSVLRRQYTEDALDRDYQDRSESGCYQYGIPSNKNLQRGGRLRGQYSRPIDSSQSQGFSRQDLHHYYYTDSLTSEQSDSPARAHSTTGWPTAYQPSPIAGRYSTGGTGLSDSEYSPEPRTYGGNRPYGRSSWAKPRATELSPALQDRGRFRKSMC